MNGQVVGWLKWNLKKVCNGKDEDSRYRRLYL